MKTTFLVNGKKFAKAGVALSEIGMKAISPGLTNRALEDAGQIIINSTKAGYLKEKSPEGDKWEDNPEWYKIMKRGAAVLTGPTSKKISSGKYAGWSFGKINRERMKNSLIKKVTTTKVTVEYNRSVKKRAELTQSGGESKVMLRKGSLQQFLKVKVQARPHLGVAYTWDRLEGKTDPEHIQEIFGKMVDFVIS